MADLLDVIKTYFIGTNKESEEKVSMGAYYALLIGEMVFSSNLMSSEDFLAYGIGGYLMTDIIVRIGNRLNYPLKIVDRKILTSNPGIIGSLREIKHHTGNWI